MKTPEYEMLSALPCGCRARVSKVEGSCAMRGRLLAMGFTPDADIEVLGCDCGRQIVKIRGCSLILDKNLAGRVICAHLPCSAPADEKD